MAETQKNIWAISFTRDVLHANLKMQLGKSLQEDDASAKLQNLTGSCHIHLVENLQLCMNV